MHLSHYAPANNAISSIGAGMKLQNVQTASSSIPKFSSSTAGVNATKSNSSISSLLGDVGSNRGELTGDACMTIDMYASDGLRACVWSEETGHTTLAPADSRLNQLVKPIISCNNKGIELLASTSPVQADDSSVVESMMVGYPTAASQVQGFVERVYPLLDLQRIQLDASGQASDYETTCRTIKAATSLLLGSGLALCKDNIQPHSTATVAAKESSSQKPKKAKKTKKVKTSVTLISPGTFHQLQTSILIAAAEQANVTVKNIFNRGVAVIAGALSRSSRSMESTIRSVSESLDLLTELESSGTVEPIVLYITTYMLEGGVASAGQATFFFEVSLIRCEGSTSCTQQQQRSNGIGNNLGFERFSTLSSVGGSMTCSRPTGDIELDKLRVAVDSALRIANDISKTSIDAVLLDGLLTGSAAIDFHETIHSSLGVDRKVKVVDSLKTDAVMGGCLLSAAELDSSKNYIQIDDQWQIAYMLPIADGVLQSGDIGMTIVWDEESSLDHSITTASLPQVIQPETVLFKVGRRLWKSDIGPVPLRHAVNPSDLMWKREFLWKSKEHARRPGFPRVHLMQRMADDASEKQWHVLKTLTPLMSDKNETVVSCTVTVAIDPSTGLLSVTEQKGGSVAESWSNFWTYVQFGLVLMLPFLLIASYYIYCYCNDLYIKWQHVAWLTAFYQQNAPQKLQGDPTYVARTVEKYKGRMFLLWRSLERSYQVKWVRMLLFD